MVGPNSAGKSAIYDALLLFQNILHSDHSSLESYFRKWSGVYAENSPIEERDINKIIIEVSFSRGEFLIGDSTFGMVTRDLLPHEYSSDTGLEAWLKKFGDDFKGPYKIRIEMLPSFFLKKNKRKNIGYYSENIFDSVEITYFVNNDVLMHIFTGDEDIPVVRFSPEPFGTMFEELADRHEIHFQDKKIYKTKPKLKDEHYTAKGHFGTSQDGFCLTSQMDNGYYEQDLILADSSTNCNTV